MADRYYHGGAVGLNVGDFILPPSETGVPCVGDFGDKTPPGYRRDRVFMTRERRHAMIYAALSPVSTARRRGGDVYLVEPVGAVVNDPDWLGRTGNSVMAERAVIVSCVRRRVPRPTREELKVLYRQVRGVGR